MNKIIPLLLISVLLACSNAKNTDKELQIKSDEQPAKRVNVFLGTSGDHGQLSPAASSPFGLMSIGPQTYPSVHAGYEYKAKEFLGFTHTRIEGVGCMGSGGNILIKPYIGSDPANCHLEKVNDRGEPGYYAVKFKNEINAEFTVSGKSGMHRYQFPKGEKGFYIDLSYAFVGRFVSESHEIEGNAVSGWVETKTTCGAGKYKLYYYILFNKSVSWQEKGPHQLIAVSEVDDDSYEISIAFSSINAEYARKSVLKNPFDSVKKNTSGEWNKALGQVAVSGGEERKDLFYSLLYRALQSPFQVSEDDGYYKTTDGTVKKSDHTVYNGWAIWDNYRTQLPLLSLAYPAIYQDVTTSLSGLYVHGKKDWATDFEPSPTVRTEHSSVVLLDAYRKGYEVDFENIIDSLKSEHERLDFSSPDKALESSYDTWALAEIYDIIGDKDQSEFYRRKALNYKTYWEKDFADLEAKDVDRMQARGLYQGTIWQYRWFVPFDMKGLIELTGGEENYINQLDEFFDGDYYNHANQPDLQVSGMYHPTSQPWKSQEVIHRLAVDTVVQHYFNDNSRGIGAYVGRIYKNQPEAYLRTMDDDAGTMSSWYVWASVGLFPACIGSPVYYIHHPLMKQITINWPNGKSFTIEVENFVQENAYIKSAQWNGEPLKRNWLTHEEIRKGGVLRLVSSSVPDKSWGTENQWVTSLE